MAAPLSKQLVSGGRLGWVAMLLLLTGCATTVVPHDWRGDAYKSFDAAISATAATSAPEETDALRKTLELAERYYKSGMTEDADGLYRLAGLESRLLSRSLRAEGRQQAVGAVLDPVAGDRHDAVAVQPDEIVFLNDAVPAEQADLSADSAPASPMQPDHAALPGVKPLHGASPIRPRHAITPSLSKPLRSRPHPGGGTIYLTFDDGPSRLTLPIASYLKSQGIQATFFVLGCNVKGHETTVSSLVAMGHRVGSHTFSHDLRKLRASFDTDNSEIGRTASLIDRLGGDGRMVRLPYGASDKYLVSHVAAEGAQIFEWDIDSYDSSKRGVHDRRFIEKTVLGQLAKTQRRRAIVLFHDGSGHDATLAALKDLIPRLKEQGYCFGILSHNDKMARLP